MFTTIGVGLLMSLNIAATQSLLERHASMQFSAVDSIE
jgi:hypothetical protein